VIVALLKVMMWLLELFAMQGKENGESLWAAHIFIILADYLIHQSSLRTKRSHENCLGTLPNGTPGTAPYSCTADMKQGTTLSHQIR
jgi:hypothetical protein